MILIYELVLDILKMYLYTKIEVFRSRLHKLRAQSGHLTDTQKDVTESITMLDSSMAKTFRSAVLTQITSVMDRPVDGQTDTLAIACYYNTVFTCNLW